MKDFAAIDFETANTERSSVCSVGIVVYKDGKKVDEFYSLIKPEPEYYNYWCSQVHGLSAEDTEEADAADSDAEAGVYGTESSFVEELLSDPSFSRPYSSIE